MSDDPFDDLLELEDEFFKEGYDAGVADSAYAGLIEGKVFGIEKGYEKALELGRLHGHALVWKRRMEDSQSDHTERTGGKTSQPDTSTTPVLPPLLENARLRKHIDALLALSDPSQLPKDNSDDAVADMDDRIAKSRSRVKMISGLVGEVMNPQTNSATGIEDSTGLSARH